MLFDTLCGIVERHLPSEMDLLKRAKLFSFPYIPQAVLPKKETISEEEWEDITDTFVLPFDIVAIEDKVSCVILRRQPKKPVEENTMGIYQTWETLEILDLTSGNEKASVNKRENRMLDLVQRSKDFHAFHIRKGTVEILSTKDKIYEMSSQCTGCWAGTKKELIDVRQPLFGLTEVFPFKEILTDMSTAVTTAIEELFMLNRSNRFVLEKQPTKLKQHGKNIPRSHQRASYTLLTVKEISTIFSQDKTIENDCRKLVEGHPRRRHIRTLRNEKFKRKDDGSFVKKVIDATWVGPETAQINGHYYKVRLDI